MSIKNLCKTKVVTIEKNTTLKDASQLMRQKQVGCVVVTEGFTGKETPVGIITDRDIALALGASVQTENLFVSHLMLYHPITVRVQDGIFETIVKMRENGVSRLPVINDDGTLYGLVTSHDILSLLAEEMRSLAKISEIQIKKEQGQRTPAERHV
jgi:CBS domain-containing protein